VTSSKQFAIVHQEALTPWVAASLLAMAAYIVGVLVGATKSGTHLVVLTVALCSVVTATELVMYRSRRLVQDAERVQRARPAAEELDAWASHRTLVRLDADTSLPPYAAGMLRYSEAVVELLEHAVSVALREGIDVSELVTGRDDAGALHNLLTTMSTEPVLLHKAAKVHTICSLWEASQDRLERAAAEIDPDFHRRWRARNISVRRLRHGDRPRRSETILPYRDLTMGE
jgi:hypothetical protein